jgi:hypothetical protein
MTPPSSVLACIAVKPSSCSHSVLKDIACQGMEPTMPRGARGPGAGLAGWLAGRQRSRGGGLRVAPAARAEHQHWARAPAHQAWLHPRAWARRHPPAARSPGTSGRAASTARPPSARHPRTWRRGRRRRPPGPAAPQWGCCPRCPPRCCPPPCLCPPPPPPCARPAAAPGRRPPGRPSRPSPAPTRRPRPRRGPPPARLPSRPPARPAASGQPRHAKAVSCWVAAATPRAPQPSSRVRSSQCGFHHPYVMSHSQETATYSATYSASRLSSPSAAPPRAPPSPAPARTAPA